MIADGHTVIDPKAFESNIGRTIPLTSCGGEHLGLATIEDVEVETDTLTGRQSVIATFSVDYPINLEIKGDVFTEPQQQTGLTGLTKESDW